MASSTWERAGDVAPSCNSCPPTYATATRGAKRLSIDFRFASGTTQLDTRGQRDLDRLITYVRALRGPKVTLLGFSDIAGDQDTNVRLSRERARKIADLLAARGIELGTVDGFGGVMPIANNDTAEHRQRNRRVEVWVSAL